MPENKIDLLYPLIRGKAHDLSDEVSKIGAKLFCGYRSLEEQKKLYAKGRTIPGAVVTDAKPGYSYHNYGLAVDVVFVDKLGDWSWDKKWPWKTLGKIGKELGFEWGGDWPSPYRADLPHFQIDCGFNIPELYFIYAKTWKLKNVWKALDDELL